MDRIIGSFGFSTLLALGLASPVMAKDEKGKEKKKASYHCETIKDGEHVDLPEVKDRKECKKQGGKWQKSHDDHGHAEGEEHKDDEK